MLNLRAYDEKEIVELQLENKPPIYLRLFRDNNRVVLSIVNKDGTYEYNAGNILSINYYGKLELYPSIDKSHNL
ncbi:MAG: hypothetical protein M0R17_03250 [Candidatus Omnitrophica bacterium]|jgi:hypothetical protein|nr:hypothetical protein [Candidatus Omnitrophota bacterium]